MYKTRAQYSDWLSVPEPGAITSRDVVPQLSVLLSLSITVAGWLDVLICVTDGGLGADFVTVPRGKPVVP